MYMELRDDEYIVRRPVNNNAVWVLVLLLPIFFILGWLANGYWMGNSFNSRPQVGVGGGPGSENATLTPNPTTTNVPTPTVTATQTPAPSKAPLFELNVNGKTPTP